MARKAKVGDTIRLKAGGDPCKKCVWCFGGSPEKINRFWRKPRTVVDISGGILWARGCDCGLYPGDVEVVARAKKGGGK